MGIFDGYTACVVILSALLAGLMYLHASGKSYEFWTGGKVRRATFEVLKRFLRVLEIL